MYLPQNNDIYIIKAAWSSQSALMKSLDGLGWTHSSELARHKLCQDTHIQYMNVRALKTHTYTLSCLLIQTTLLHNTERKRGTKHQIKPSLSNPLIRVIKDTHSLLCEALSPNLNAEQLLPGFGFRALGPPSGVLATSETQLSLPTD